MKKAKKFVVVSDIHGNHMDKTAVDIALKFTKDFKPYYKIINGDLFDAACLRQGASRSDQNVGLIEDVEAGLWFAREFFGSSKGGENHFLMGNHDRRLLDTAYSSMNAAKRERAMMAWEEIKNEITNKYKATIHPYKAKSLLKLGHLGFHHGNACGKNSGTIMVNAYGGVVYGHTHTISATVADHIDGHMSFNQGCLCNLDLEYADIRVATLRWMHGFGYGYIFEDDTYKYEQMVIINGHAVAATQWKDYGHKKT